MVAQCSSSTGASSAPLTVSGIRFWFQVFTFQPPKLTVLGTRSRSLVATVEQTRHRYGSQGQILALAFWSKAFKPLKVPSWLGSGRLARGPPILPKPEPEYVVSSILLSIFGPNLRATYRGLDTRDHGSESTRDEGPGFGSSEFRVYGIWYRIEGRGVPRATATLGAPGGGAERRRIGISCSRTRGLGFRVQGLVLRGKKGL